MEISSEEMLEAASKPKEYVVTKRRKYEFSTEWKKFITKVVELERDFCIYCGSKDDLSFDLWEINDSVQPSYYKVTYCEKCKDFFSEQEHFNLAPDVSVKSMDDIQEDIMEVFRTQSTITSLTAFELHGEERSELTEQEKERLEEIKKEIES